MCYLSVGSMGDDNIKPQKIENVRMLDKYNSRNACVGGLYLTTTHLIFAAPKKETWILHTHIANVEKLPITTEGCPLQIKCKTFRSETYIIPRERDSHEVFNNLQKLAKPIHISDLYCFRYTSSEEEIPKSAGWNFFDMQAEFQRMRVPNEQWNLTLLNKDYELCSSYPTMLFVPSTATPSILVGSSKFRSKGRLPVLTYLHKNKAAICRCSQPLSGFKARSLEDEQMLDCVLNTNPSAPHMIVVDTRPRINAMANRATGKGYENEKFYENMKFHFLGIENIHVMRSSLAKLVESCELKSPPMSSFLNNVESSGWLRHLKSVLDTSWFIAQAVCSGVNVLVHCSDGWDRTSQVCSLASLLLDPYYRTIQGYQALIEKDWLNFGHKFTDRLGHLAGDSKEISPVFTQFVDCTWQLLQQFPCAFQFNEHFLLTLHDHTSSCQYGTFVGNCEKERRELRLNEKTYSVWGYMANHMNEYINPLYDADTWNIVLTPNIISQNMKLWKGIYYRFEGGVHPREVISDLLLVASNHSNSLNQHIKLLNKKIKNAAVMLQNCPSIDGEGSGKQTKKQCSKIDDALTQPMPDDPLRSPSRNFCTSNSRDSQLSTSDLATSLVLDWKSFRSVEACSCSTPFDHFTEKYHCWQCGDIFCTRCIVKHIALPGHLSQCAVPVCTSCYRKIKGLSSIDTP